ncbi:MAG: response regulator transcription factor [Candidatus Obscuribacterales bacterium]|nr:response regulator transcription factor [Candidatus Obscuribacterales bacterium]
MSSVNPIRVLIADDHGILREALRSFLQRQAEFEVVGEASTGTEVLEKCNALNPDIVIMDISMPSMNGIECAQVLRDKNPQVRVLTLTSFEDEEHLKDCLLAGVNAYVLKRSFSEDLKLALLTVYRGGTYIDAAISKNLRALLKVDESVHSSPLSDREMQVIALIAKGLSLKDVGNQLKISVKTVETYKARSLEKLNLRSRAELVKYALENGLLNGASEQ